MYCLTVVDLACSNDTEQVMVQLTEFCFPVSVSCCDGEYISL